MAAKICLHFICSFTATQSFPFAVRSIHLTPSSAFSSLTPTDLMSSFTPSINRSSSRPPPGCQFQPEDLSIQLFTGPSSVNVQTISFCALSLHLQKHLTWTGCPVDVFIPDLHHPGHCQKRSSGASSQQPLFMFCRLQLPFLFLAILPVFAFDGKPGLKA